MGRKPLLIVGDGGGLWSALGRDGGYRFHGPARHDPEGPMISALTNRGRLHFMVFKEEFCAQVSLTFLRRLLRLVERRVYIILDKHPVHRSREVKHWLDKDARRIRVFFLPGYSPGLNPDELLNQHVKTNVGGRRRPRDQAQMLRSLRSYLRSRQRQPHIVRKYLREEHVRYAAT